MTIGHLLASRHSGSTDSNAHELLFVGTLTKENEFGVEFFMEEILPRIQSRYPDTRLLICGKICSVIADSPHSIKLGVVEDISTAYERAGIVINPAYLGTGLAIKSIEALSYGKPLVTTPQGARGLEEGRDRAFLVGHTAEDFSRHIIHLFDDIDFRKKFSVRAYEFARSYQADNLSKLAMIVKYQK
ncbi:MAG: glycosyltransferase family 4 protein [bacterium]